MSARGLARTYTAYTGASWRLNGYPPIPRVSDGAAHSRWPNRAAGRACGGSAQRAGKRAVHARVDRRPGGREDRLPDGARAADGREGWAVLAYQARRERNVVRELLEELPDALRQSWPVRSLRGLQRELSVELNAGVVKVTGKLTAPASDQRDLVTPLQRTLRRVGERAAKRGSGLLVTIDEAQTVPLDALADLGMIIQTVAHRDSLPVAFVFAGTPELGEILLRSGSFLERMPRTELRMLTGEEIRLALLEPASATGSLGARTRSIWSPPPPAAIRTLRRSAASERGAPPKAARASRWPPARPARRDRRDRRSDVPRPLEAARPAQQRYLAAAAVRTRVAPHRAVPTAEIAAALAAPDPTITSQRSLITEHHLLRPGDYGHVESRSPGSPSGCKTSWPQAAMRRTRATPCASPTSPRHVRRAGR